MPSIDIAPTRQHPVAAYLEERVGKDSPHYLAVLRSLWPISRLGIEITKEMVDKALLLELLRTPRPEEEVIPDIPEPQVVRWRIKGDAHTISWRPGMVVPPRLSVVYYMRMGNRIKIGTTGNLVQRMSAINPEELMAVEAGNAQVERRRHNQFRALRSHGEWFRQEEPLIEHIKKIRALGAKRDRAARRGTDPR